MQLRVEVDLGYRVSTPADVLLAIEATSMADQRLLNDRLTIRGTEPLHSVEGDDGVGRRSWIHADGEFHVQYAGQFDVERDLEPIADLSVSPLAELPPQVIPYLWPSRFCPSDRFESFVEHEFRDLEGGALVNAMAIWVRNKIQYRPGASHGTTSAVDTFIAREGVCRDYAHLMAAFARAAGIPARLVSAYAWQLDPPDFHAVVEVWLDGGWRLVDASGLAPVEGLVRIAVGRDATDIAFMTIFGTADLVHQQVRVERTD